MGSVFVDQGFSRVAHEQFRNNQKPDVLFAVERLLKYVTSVAVRGKFNNILPIKHFIKRGGLLV